MLRNKLCLAVLAALMVAPVASQASILSRRLTPRYPGQDGRKHHHRDRWEPRRDDRREDRRDHRREGRHDHRWEGRRDR